MGSLVLGGGFDVVGDGDEEMHTMGGTATRSRSPVRVPTPPWMNAATSQGVSRPQEEMDFLPFEALVLATGVLTGVLLARPQRPFRGERLILSAVDLDTGTDVSFLCTINPAIYVGAVQIGAAQGGTPFTTFGAGAFGVRLSLPAAGQGTDIKIYCAALVNASTKGLALNGTIIGRAMR